MQGLWLEKGQLQFREDIPMPTPGKGEAMVRVLMSGICSTDHQLVKGMYPFTGVPGHEFVGVVENGPQALVGKRVVGEINVGCGRCEACTGGFVKHCDTRTVLGIRERNGSLAEKLVLPCENLHPVPDHIPNEQAVFVEPLAAALEIQEQIPIDSRDHVLVAGDGKLGQLIAQTLRFTGCALAVLGRHEKKLKPLRNLGVEIVSLPDIKNRRFNVVVECTGNRDGLALAKNAVRKRGTIVLKSTYAGLVSLDAASIAVDELKIVGSRCGPFEKALALLAESDMDLGYMIDAVYPLPQAKAAFVHSQIPGTLKILVQNEME